MKEPSDELCAVREGLECAEDDEENADGAEEAGEGMLGGGGVVLEGLDGEGWGVCRHGRLFYSFAVGAANGRRVASGGQAGAEVRTKKRGHKRS